MTATDTKQLRLEPLVFGAVRHRTTVVLARAVSIPNAAVGSNRLAVRDFSGDGKSLKVATPNRVAAGTHGTSTVTVSFTWPGVKIAQMAANAILQAFDEVRSAAIRSQGNAPLAAITKAMANAQSEDQRLELLNQRTQAFVIQQTDLVHHPMIAWATEPQVSINYNLKNVTELPRLVSCG